MKRYSGFCAVSLLLLISACGASKLFKAVESGNVPEINQLLATGADANSRGDKGITPLFSAAASGSKDVAEILIAHGADVNAKNNDGFTPLFAAAYRNRKELVELLISKGANVNVKSTNGWTPLHKAVERLAGPWTRRHPPAEADISAMMDIVNLLLTKGAEVDAKASNGITPLIFAAGSGQKALVELLISHGADVNSKGFEGVGALYMAAIMDRGEVAELLLAHGAEVDARTQSGFTPLSYTAREGNREFSKLLIAHGAEVNAKDSIEGKTPLLWNLSIAAAASPAGQKLMLPKLTTRDKWQIKKEIKMAKGQWSETAKLLIDHGANVEIADIKGNTPLYLAALIGDLGLVEALIDHGATLDDARAGETALHASIAERHGDIATLLINKGANVNVKNVSGRTPLHFLATFMDDRNLTELLVNHGADINASDKDGNTPLYFAIKTGNKQVAEALRLHNAK